jgi:hypothetical protein
MSQRNSVDQRRTRVVSTRHLGAAVASFAGISGVLAAAAAPADANAGRHAYYGPNHCPTPIATNEKGPTIDTPIGSSAKMSNWGHAGNTCSGGTNQGYACITEFSNGSNVRGAGSYYCGQPGYTQFSRHTYSGPLFPNKVYPVVRLAKANQHQHYTTGSSANTF